LREAFSDKLYMCEIDANLEDDGWNIKENNKIFSGIEDG
jgi:tRNA-binding EMAP/Myf-like protein